MLTYPIREVLAMDLSWLRPLYDQPGPWASVYFDASHNSEEAATAIDLRWRAQRRTLADAGAESATLDAIEAAVRDEPPQPGRDGLALFAAGGQVRLVRHLGAPPPADLATWEALPHARPMIAQLGEEVAWLRVLADRTGADLDGVTAGGVPRHAHVRGSETYPLRKAKPGGWSQPRYQNAAENAWKHNAGDVAAAAAQLAAEIGAEVLVVAGDVRAVQLVVDRLPARWQERTVQTDAGSRAPGTAADTVDDITVQAVAETAARHTDAAVERYREQYGAGRAAGTGLAAVAAAFQRSQVETLLLGTESPVAGELWIGPEPAQVATDVEDVRAMGVATPLRVPADAAIMRAAAGTDAEVVLVGPDEAPLEDGLGAVLRY